MCVFAHQSVSLGLKDGPGVDKRLVPVPPIFTADTGVFESSPGRLRIIRHAVDHDTPGPYLGGHATRALKVGPKDGAVEPIFRVIRDPDRLISSCSVTSMAVPTRPLKTPCSTTGIATQRT